jgi:hypothetical protein
MDSLAIAIQTLKNAGYTLRGCRVGFICLEDPTCIWPPLLDFIHVAWMVLAIITAFLLAGWGITMVRGANHDMVKNLRTLILIFGTLSVALPAVDVLGGGAFVLEHCATIEISKAEVDKLLNMRDVKMKEPKYEHFLIKDSYDSLEYQDSQVDDLEDEFNF